MASGPQVPISVLVQTKNEAIGITACLQSLSDFDEVIVVDSNSSDATKSLALDAGASVVNFTWDGFYPKKKQWQIDNVKTRNPWVLFLDADETVTAELLEALRDAQADLNKVSFVAYDLRLEYVFEGKSLMHGHRVTKRALVHRDHVRFPVIDDLDAPGMGELEGHYQPIVDGQVGTLGGRLRHDDKDPIRTWFDRHNRYSDWEAYLRTNRDSRSSVAIRRSKQGKLFDAVPFKPLVFFVYSYVFRLGFLDGRAGLDYALALSMYYWQIGLKTRERENELSNEQANGPIDTTVSKES